MTLRTTLRSTVGSLVEQGRRVLDAPSPLHQQPERWSRYTTQEGRDLADRLRRDGIVILPGFFTPDVLARARAGVQAQFEPELAPDMEFDRANHYYSSRQPLGICPEFALAAIDPDLLTIVGRYFRREVVIWESDFRRVLPLDMAEFGSENPKFAKGHSSSHWHHDVHGREIKVMIYLTDVGPEDQNFAFCLRSQTGFRSVKYENSRFTDEEVVARGYEIVEYYAPAGTAIAFDTNGIHRLRRRKTNRIRDSVTFNYRPRRAAGNVPQKVHPQALRARRSDFERLASIQPA
jgi:hypothetical protein